MVVLELFKRSISSILRFGFRVRVPRIHVTTDLVRARASSSEDIAVVHIMNREYESIRKYENIKKC